MRVAIAGAGNVGRFLAQDLVGAGHSVLVIEANVDLVTKLRRTLDVDWFAGDACEVKNLDRARIGEADVVVAATGEDQVNLVISLLAKQEFAVPRVIARVNHPKNEWLFNQAWGVDVAVSTPHLLGALVEEAFSVGSFVRLLQFAGGEARLVEVTLAEDSPARNLTLAQMEVPRDASVVAVVRSGRVVIPRGDTVLCAGDEVLVLITADSEEQVKRLLVGDRVGPTAH